MLVFTRKAKESFHIGDDVKVVILSTDQNRTRIGIEAPRDVEVHRSEIFDKIQAEKEVEAEA